MASGSTTPTPETAAAAAAATETNDSKQGTKLSVREEVDYLPRRLALPRCLLVCDTNREREKHNNGVPSRTCRQCTIPLGHPLSIPFTE